MFRFGKITSHSQLKTRKKIGLSEKTILLSSDNQGKSKPFLVDLWI